jgi:hypothetical protein
MYVYIGARMCYSFGLIPNEGFHMNTLPLPSAIQAEKRSNLPFLLRFSFILAGIAIVLANQVLLGVLTLLSGLRTWTIPMMGDGRREQFPPPRIWIRIATAARSVVR